jgi:membrane protein DedA with SNARE-associated domain/rhodanese-related sulfurtransferase
MSTVIEMLVKHGYLILFLAVMAEQIGLPLPSVPVIIAAGALAGLHQLHAVHALISAIVATLLADSLWFFFGRRRGVAILEFLAKMSLDPETYVTKAQSAYSRHDSGAILVSKFVPGLGTIVPPLAGFSRLALWKFLSLDALAALMWAGAYMGLGWVFRDQIELLADFLRRFGLWMGMLAAAVLALFVAMKYRERRRIYRALRVQRITAHELKKKMANGEPLTIVDLRNRTERAQGVIPTSIALTELTPGAILEAASQSDIVMYCECPNEFTSAREALRLRRLGIAHVHPLEGGFPRWRDLGFPVEKIEAEIEAEPSSLHSAARATSP